MADKTLKLFKCSTTGDPTPFPAESSQIEISAYKYTAKRMGNAPSITATVNYPEHIDHLWDDNVYAEFRGERYFLKRLPSSSKDNTDITYKYSIELVSERVVLESVYFFDVVKENTEDDRPVSNSSDFSFSGDVRQFAERFNHSAKWSGVDYTVVVDDDVELEDKFIQFQDQFLYDALKGMYDTYQVPFYFVGKTIHIGYSQHTIDNVLKYGADDALLSISRNNTNANIVNRITGTGSDKNITYYYPNPTPKGYISLYDESDGLVSITDFSKFASNMPVDTEFKFDRGLINNGALYSPNVVYKIESKGHGEELEVDENRDYTAYIKGNEEYDNDRYYINYPLGFLAPGDYKFRIQVLPKTLQVGDTANFTYKVHVSNLNVKTTRVDDRTLVIHLDDVLYASDLSFEICFVPASGAQTPFTAIFSLPKLSPLELDSFKLINVSNGKETKISDLGLSVSEEIPHHGTKIKQIIDKRVNVQNNLMPSLYRETDGRDRFYNAENGKYKDDDGNDITFANQFSLSHPREYIHKDEEIYPTIEGMVNANGLRIDVFSEFAFDDNDNDDIYPAGHEKEGQYVHPYFFGKLRKFDGEHGFNIFDQAIEGQPMTVTMKSGKCSACEFTIGVDEETNSFNPVQVTLTDKITLDGRIPAGTLVRDDDGNVMCGRWPQQKPQKQERQNDTANFEVWIALKKDIQTFGDIMPSRMRNYIPEAGDKFALLNINLPQAYVLAAEDKLEKAVIAYMAENNSQKFNYSAKLSRIFFKENLVIANTLNENSKVSIEYGNFKEDLYVSSYSYDIKESDSLPEVSIELDNEIKTNKGAIDRLKGEIDNKYKKPLVNIKVDTAKIASNLSFVRKKTYDINTAAEKAVAQSTQAIEAGAQLTLSVENVQASVLKVEGVANLAKEEAAIAKDEITGIGNEIGVINSSIKVVKADTSKALKSIASTDAELVRVKDQATADVNRIDKSLGKLTNDVSTLEGLVGDEYNIWFENEEQKGNEPALDNYPASDWTTDDDYFNHDKDLYYSIFLGRAWRFMYNEGEPYWEEITDADTITALTKAKEALDKANEAMEAVNDLEYLKDVFGDTEVMDEHAVILSRLLAVSDDNDNVVAGVYGGGVSGLDNSGYKDDSHGTLMMFAGADNASNASAADFRVYSDGCIFANSGTFGGITKRSKKYISSSNLDDYTYFDANKGRVLDLTKTGSFIVFGSLTTPNLTVRLPWYSSDADISQVDKLDDLLSILGTKIIVRFTMLGDNFCFDAALLKDGPISQECLIIDTSTTYVFECKAVKDSSGSINVGWEMTVL